MPYFIYRITERPIKLLNKLEEHEVFRNASARVKELRAEQGADSNAVIKMIHAETELQAEDLLNEIRERQPELGDD